MRLFFVSWPRRIDNIPKANGGLPRLNRLLLYHLLGRGFAILANFSRGSTFIARMFAARCWGVIAQSFSVCVDDRIVHTTQDEPRQLL
jgi:hypothetical protein